jgi:pilus assembly protein CpaB
MFQDINAVTERGVIVPMDINEPVLESRLAPKEAGAGLTTAIPDGMRAISIRVNDVIGVAGFVVPGTHVDVILTGNPGKEAPGEVAKTILENVQVLAAGQNVDSDAQGRPQAAQVVTLLVTPVDSQKLALASSEGRMQLSLRNPLDQEPTSPPLMQSAALYYGGTSVPAPAAPPAEKPVRKVVAKPAPVLPPPVAPPAPVAPKKFEVQLIQGKTSETVTFATPQPQ